MLKSGQCSQYLRLLLNSNVVFNSNVLQLRTDSACWALRVSARFTLLKSNDLVLLKHSRCQLAASCTDSWHDCADPMSLAARRISRMSVNHADVSNLHVVYLAKIQQRYGLRSSQPEPLRHVQRPNHISDSQAWLSQQKRPCKATELRKLFTQRASLLNIFALCGSKPDTQHVVKSSAHPIYVNLRSWTCPLV